jgi:hypothetical protein
VCKGTLEIRKGYGGAQEQLLLLPSLQRKNQESGLLGITKMIT